MYENMSAVEVMDEVQSILPRTTIMDGNLAEAHFRARQMIVDLEDALRRLLDAAPPCDCGIQGCGRDNCREAQREAARLNARAVISRVRGGAA